MALLDRPFNHFHEIAAAFPKAISAIVRETTEDILDEARSNAPRDTGKLADSGHTDYFQAADGVNRGYVVFDAQNENGVPYGPFVEVGTVDTPAQPFLIPAVEHGQHRLDAAGGELEGRLGGRR